MKKPIVLVIGGPTASGKTAFSIDLALTIGTEIINADSRQVYQELSIGVARPSMNELGLVPHHFVGSASIYHPLSAGAFGSQATKVLDALLAEHGIAIVCGGSGLYIQALLHGFDSTDSTNDELRQEIEKTYQMQGLEAIVQQLLDVSPSAGEYLSLQNPARVKRALELVQLHKKEIQDIWQGAVKQNQFEVLGYYLNPPRQELYKNIDNRVDQMMQMGLLEEARQVYENASLRHLKTVGYAELFPYFDGKTSLEAAVNLIKQHTRNFAKRQVTWFKNKTNFKPLEGDSYINTIFDDLNLHGYTIHR